MYFLVVYIVNCKCSRRSFEWRLLLISSLICRNLRMYLLFVYVLTWYIFTHYGGSAQQEAIRLDNFINVTKLVLLHFRAFYKYFWSISDLWCPEDLTHKHWQFWVLVSKVVFSTASWNVVFAPLHKSFHGLHFFLKILVLVCFLSFQLVMPLYVSIVLVAPGHSTLTT